MVTARIGEMVVSTTAEQELVALGLGSCVAVAMTDASAGVAGLAHVMLPDSGGARVISVAKFADTAIPALLRSVLASGAHRSRLRVAIAGGAAMFGGRPQLDIGARNIEAVRAALSTAGLRVAAADVGGEIGRTIRVDVTSGAATIRAIGDEPVQLLAPLTITRGSV